MLLYIVLLLSVISFAICIVFISFQMLSTILILYIVFSI